MHNTTPQPPPTAQKKKIADKFRDSTAALDLPQSPHETPDRLATAPQPQLDQLPPARNAPQPQPQLDQLVPDQLGRPPPDQLPVINNVPLMPDQLVPDPTVAKEFHVCLETLWRWSQDPDLGFPPPVKIRNRNFRSRRELDEFKERLMRQAIAERSKAQRG